MAEDLFDVIDPGEADDAASAAAPTPAGEDGAGAASGTAKVRLRVHVRPGAGRSAVVGTYGDALHLRVAAPPVGGRANEACRELLTELLGYREIELVGGERSADKRFVISGVDPAELRRRLHEVIEEAGSQPGSGSTKHRGRR